MLYKEAKWLGAEIANLKHENVYPMLNVGSSTEEFRKIQQPWIDQFLFASARKNGLKVVHTDIKEADGVDIVGDLCIEGFLSELTSVKFKSVLCANLLEHVTNKEEICKALEKIVLPGGNIIVTVPHNYPYHADPIDTGYRPTPKELSRLFPNSSIIQSEIVDCGTHFDRLRYNHRLLIKTLIFLCLPFYKPAVWVRTLQAQLWLFKKFTVTCAVLERK